ncbi:MAG: carboxypeptidase-like regulatory domain-containing protein [Saprospiraceae bacterium]|nr:carboxypeptidase-like regulatory domain-containing protein [Saprospiraceae bacterium]
MQLRHLLSFFLMLFISISGYSQNVIKGKIIDAGNGDPLIGANILVKGTANGNITDYDGYFEVNTDADFPLTVVVSYLGYIEKEVEVLSADNITIALEENSVTVDVVEVKASRISEENKKSPLTIEALDNIAIKETPAADFYSGLGALKGVDLTAASLGFKVVNTRGFNSTSPVRSLQIIDGVDNQAPGLNFSLGNFLGSSELDVNKVEIIVGASSAFYGPNAFNGVISMETKDPFYHKGLSASVKVGERNMLKTAVRFADAFQNKNEDDVFAYKLNLEYLRADDWIADNYDPVDGTESGLGNPGRWDAVNIYGDEYQSGNDFTTIPLTANTAGLGIWHRTGYREIDLVDYDTRNYKANASFHLKTRPSQTFESPEIVFTSSFGGGTTVYQGDNRFSLKGITFFQNKLEYRKLNKYFIRAYATTTTAGDSYDPYFTALKLIENGKPDREWSQAYIDYWVDNVRDQMVADGFPVLTGTFPNFMFDLEGAEQWLVDNNPDMISYHQMAEAFANAQSETTSGSPGFFQPGTPEFDAQFNAITTAFRDGTEGGTRFFDQSSLYHVHGEYKFNPLWTDEITLGANGRLYTPQSNGTIFGDRDTSITNKEYGVYVGITKSIIPNKLKAQGAMRLDKNENFDYLTSPAASLVYTPSEKDFFRVSFSSAIRNPTLSDQYLNLDVGRAILAGNLNGREDLVTVESLRTFFNTQQQDSLVFFDIGPIQPEKVKTFEVGARTTLFEKLYVDAGYYYSIYDNFIGFKIGVEADINAALGTINNIQAYRFATNSTTTVTTQGVAIGLNYYFAPKYSLQGNYSWNKLNTETEDDPIIPAFNTPEHKFNIGINGRDISLFNMIDHVGFNVNYKWVEGFIFEGSPQFTGEIPTYDMLDAQINVFVPSLHMTFKLGASNLLNKMNFQTYGGPRIGRLGYFQITYDMGRKK